MKKLLSLLSISALLLGCTGAEPEKPTPKPTPEADKVTVTSGSSLVFQSEESTETSTINSNVAWKATATESWIELSPSNGASGNASITVKVKANESTDERNASVTITGGTASASVKITQKQKDALIVSEAKVEIGGAGGEFEVEVKSSVDVQHIIDVDWIKLVSTKAMTAKTWMFAVEESEEKEKREGTITFTAGSLQEEVKVYQAEGGDIFVLSQKEYELTKDAQEIKIELRSNIGFSTIEIPADVDWIEEVETKLSSTYTKYLWISENDTFDNREAKVDIYNEDKSRKETITIWQSQTDSLGVVKSEYDVAPEGGIIEVDVRHNIDFTVEIPADVDWVHRVDTKGIKSTKVQFEIAENSGSADRECCITIKGKDFERAINIKQNAVHTKIFYTSTDGKIVEPTQLTAWDIDNRELKFSNTYGEEVGVIEFEGKVQFINLSYRVQCGKLLTFDGISNKVYLKDAYCMFLECTSLKSLDLGSFDTSNVTNMAAMFSNCSSLKKLDLSCFNTENVTNMREMFSHCTSLKTLDLSNFDTKNVTSMEDIFFNCLSLQSLDLSGFSTERVTNMRSMFFGCSSIQSLDLSNFNTENVTDMYMMVCGCSSLQSLNLSGLNTKSVSNMGYMFQNCSSLQKLDLSGFDTENVTDMSALLGGCSSLKEVDVSNFNTENVIDMSALFGGCSSLEEIYLNNFITSSVINMDSMFDGCSSLKALDLSHFNTENVTNMRLMFRHCYSLQALDLSHFNTENVTDMEFMFSSCSSLRNLKVGEMTNRGKISANTFFLMKENGILYYPHGCDYSEWLNNDNLGYYGWTGQEY